MDDGFRISQCVADNMLRAFFFVGAGNTSGLLLNNLGISANCEIVFDSSDPAFGIPDNQTSDFFYQELAASRSMSSQEPFGGQLGSGDVAPELNMDSQNIFTGVLVFCLVRFHPVLVDMFRLGSSPLVPSIV